MYFHLLCGLVTSVCYEYAISVILNHTGDPHISYQINMSSLGISLMTTIAIFIVTFNTPHPVGVSMVLLLLPVWLMVIQMAQQLGVYLHPVWEWYNRRYRPHIYGEPQPSCAIRLYEYNFTERRLIFYPDPVHDPM